MPPFFCVFRGFCVPYSSTDCSAVGLASPEGAKDYRRGYHPRVSDAQYKEALKGRKIFRAFSTPFIGSNINGDYHPRLCSLQPFRLLLGRSEFFIFF